MTEKATYCPRCKGMHVGICPLALADKAVEQPVRKDMRHFGTSFVKFSADGTATRIAPEEVLLPVAQTTIANAAEIEAFLSNPDPKAKALPLVLAPTFDKRAYQREYMRKRRARLLAGND